MLMRMHRRPPERKEKKEAAEERERESPEDVKETARQETPKEKTESPLNICVQSTWDVLKAGLKPHQPQAPQTTKLTCSTLNSICMLAHSWEEYQQSHLV